MARKQQVYSDFSGGFNDSVAAISIKDTEVCISENADYSTEIKSFKTRKGCTKVNQTSFNNNVDDTYGWSIGSKNKKCLVIDGKIYDLDDYDDTNGTFSRIKYTLTTGTKKIYPFVMFNRLYFGDGTKMYVWGDFDFESETDGSVSVENGKIVKNTSSTSGESVKGRFYQYTGTTATINLKNENFIAEGAPWTDVTEAQNFASNVVREVTTEDKSTAESIRISVLSGSTTQSNLVLYLDNVAYTISNVPANSDVNTIVNLLPTAKDGSNNLVTTVWDTSKDGNTMVFTKKTKGLCQNGYIDPMTTGASLTYVTEVEGSENDNDLSPIFKCTMFVVHTASYRVFACGNPDDNAVFYSEIGDPTYFKSDINKVYASNSYGKPTGMKQMSDTVLVSFETGWYAWNGIDPLDDATWKQLNIPYGCVSNRTIALTPNSFIFLAKDGIYNVSASILNYEYVLLQSKTIINKITRSKVDNTIASIYDITKCEAIFDNNVYYLSYNKNTASEYSSIKSYAVGDYCTHDNKRYICIENTIGTWDSTKWSLSTPTNDYVLKYEWDTASFTTVTGWTVNAWLIDSDGIFFGTKNYLLKANVGYSDIDVDTGIKKSINTYIKTKEYHFGNPFYDKVVNLIGLMFKQPSGDYEINADVNVIMGYNSYAVNTLNITESLIWGRDWGLVWGFREAVVKMIELTESSNSFQLEIRNNSIDSPLSVVAIGFVYEETDFIKVTDFKDEDLLQ